MPKLPAITTKEWNFANSITNNTVVGTPTWIEKFPDGRTHGKTVPRLLIVGKYFVFTVKNGMTGSLKVAKTAHIYDVMQMGHVDGQDNVMEIVFMRDEKHLFDLRFANTPSASLDQSIGLSVLFTIQCARMQISYKFPQNMLHYIPERSLELLAEMPRPWERMMPAQAHVETYQATVTYEEGAVRDTVVSHIYSQLTGLSYRSDPDAVDPKTIDLTECFKGVSSPSFGNKDVNAICSIIAHSPWFKTVTAEGMTVSVLGTKVLFAAIANKQVIDKIIFKNMSITAAKLEQVSAIGGAVKVLDLSKNPLTDAGLTHLSSAFVPEEFDDDDYTCALTELYLSKCSIKAGPGFQTLCSNILSTTMTSTLKIFDLSYNYIGPKGSEALGLFLALSQTLTTLNLVNTQMDSAVCLEPLKLNNRLWTSLETLDISRNPFNRDAAGALGDFLKKTEKLSSLTMTNMTTLTSVCYANILSSLFSNTSPNLANNVALNFSRNKFTHADVATVSTHIEASTRFPVSSLSLNDCGFGIEGMSLVAQSIVERKPGTLRSFYAARNMSPGFFTSAGTIHGAQTALSRLVKSSEPLVEMDLSGDSSNRFGEHIIPIVEALKGSKTLKHVDVSKHKAGNKLVDAIGEVLAVNKVISEIWFDKNGTTLAGFEKLLNKLEGSESVVSIGPPISDLARAEKKEKEGVEACRAKIEELCARNAKRVQESGGAVDAAITDMSQAENRHRRYSTALKRTKSRGGGGHEDDDDEEHEDVGEDEKVEVVEKEAAEGDEAGEGRADDVEKQEEEPESLDEDDEEEAKRTKERSSIELKLHLLQLAQAEANDAKAEMEAKLEDARLQQQKLIEEAKKETEQALRAEMDEKIQLEIQDKIQAAKETAIAEAESQAIQLQEELAQNQQQVLELQENAEKEKQKLEQTLNEKAEKELKEQMQILKKATGMAEAELEWAIESSNGNAFLMAEEKKAYHELEYSKMMFEMSKLDKMMYLLKNPNIGRALTSASKSIAEERVLTKKDSGGKGNGEEREDDKAPLLGSRKPPAFLAQLRTKGGCGGDGDGEDQSVASGGSGGRPNPFGGPGANPFAAAAATKGLVGGGLGAPMGGRGFLSQLTGGARTGAKGKTVTIKSAREKLVKLLVGEKKQVEQIPFKLKDFNVIVDALEKVLASGEADFAATAKEVNEELKQKDKDLKVQLLKVQQSNTKHEGQIEIWNERMNTAPERAEELTKREEEWLGKQKEANELCLKITRSYIPLNISSLSVKGYLEAVKKEGGLATFALAERLREKKLLHWCVMHKDDIARENFLMGANVSCFKNLGDYDVTELRAVYACLPATFELDSTPGKVGQKLEWKNGLINKLKSMTAQQDGETVKSGWDPVNEVEKEEKLKPLRAIDERHPGYYYPDEATMEAKTTHFVGIEERLEGLKKRRKELQGEEGGGQGLVAEMKAERDAALEDLRSEYLQQQYGKEVLKTLKADAEKAYKKGVDELGVLKVGDKGKVTGKGLLFKVWQSEENIRNATPNKAELLEEFAKIRGQKLQVADAENDAATVCGVLEIGYEDVLKRFCSFDVTGRGQVIGGVFDTEPEMKKKERSAFKKLSDEEEARQRKIDMEKAMAARSEGGGKGVKEGLLGGINNSGDVGVSGAACEKGAGVGGGGPVKTSASMRAMLEAQHGGTIKKVKKEIVKREPKSKALKARASVLASCDGGALENAAGGGVGGMIAARPPNPLLGSIQARGPNPMASAIKSARPPNPMLAAIQSRGNGRGGGGGIPRQANPFLNAIKKRGGGDDGGGMPKPPNPMLAAIQARGPKASDPMAAQLAERNAASSMPVGEIGVPAKRRPPPLPKKKS